MRKQKLLKLLTLVFTLIILATMAINASALTRNRMGLDTNVPDRSIDRRDAVSESVENKETTPRETNETQKQTGVIDDAIDKASEALDDITGALGDMKDDVDNAIDNTDEGNSFMGVVIAILIAVAIIILIIVMVSKNTGKHNR